MRELAAYRQGVVHSHRVLMRVFYSAAVLLAVNYEGPRSILAVSAAVCASLFLHFLMASR
jgi:hypothetical protein